MQGQQSKEECVVKTAIGAFLAAVTMFPLTFFFLWRLSKGMNPAEVFLGFLTMTIIVSLGVKFTTAVAVSIVDAIKKKWPKRFVAPPPPPTWLVAVTASVAIATCLVGGYLDGWVTGILLFWPSMILCAFLAQGVNWCLYQFRRND